MTNPRDIIESLLKEAEIKEAHYRRLGITDVAQIVMGRKAALQEALRALDGKDPRNPYDV